MTNIQTITDNVETQESYLEECGISNEQFEQMIDEAEQDIKNGNLFSLEEVMGVGLEVLKNKMQELPAKEQIKAKEFLNSWRI